MSIPPAKNPAQLDLFYNVYNLVQAASIANRHTLSCKAMSMIRIPSSPGFPFRKTFVYPVRLSADVHKLQYHTVAVLGMVVLQRTLIALYESMGEVKYSKGLNLSVITHSN